MSVLVKDQMRETLHCKQHIGNARQAFFIFEAVVYMALISICMVIFMRAIADVMNHTQTSGNDAYNFVNVTTALDSCVRDAWKGAWDGVQTFEKGFVIVTHADKDYGWELKKGILYRIEGAYDSKNRRWLKRRRNKIAFNVESFVCHKNNDHSTILIEVVYNKTYKLNRCVRFKNYEQ